MKTPACTEQHQEEQQQGVEDVQDVADAVAGRVLDQYHSLPRNGKPLQDQFTVLAGIVARVKHHHSPGEGEGTGSASGPTRSHLLNVCLATGTKCLGSNAPLAFPGSTLADSHAEVLCRRAFNRFLLQSINQLLMDPTYQSHPHCPVERVESTRDERMADANVERALFKVKNNWEFWMYISDSPCGDACIYDREEIGASYTGQKTFQVDELVSSDSTNTRKLSSRLRTKPGRKDIKSHLRSSSMSCSDKIARWMCLGTQGALLAHLLQGSIHLHGLVVSADTGACPGAQLSALNRSLADRIREAFPSTIDDGLEVRVQPVFPHISITSSLFQQGKSYSEILSRKNSQGHAPVTVESTIGMSKRQLKKAAKLHPTMKPAGNNLNWIMDVPSTSGIPMKGHCMAETAQSVHGSIEVTISSTGILQGSTATTVVAAKQGDNRKRVSSSPILNCNAKKKKENENTLTTDGCASDFIDTDDHDANKLHASIAPCFMPSFQSRLSRRELGKIFNRIVAHCECFVKSDDQCSCERIIETEYNHNNYARFKTLSQSYSNTRHMFLANEAFRNWLTADKHEKIMDDCDDRHLT